MIRNALDAVFERARAEGRGALMPYLTGGYPEPESFIDLASAVLAEADLMELGIPFSDPLLDGQSVQRSAQQALQAGVTPGDCLQYARAIHERTGKTLLLMTPYNPVLAYGVERLCRESEGAGIAGLIVTDVPIEESKELRETATAHNLHVIQLLAPTSTPERIRRICAAASGFIYCISVAGVTGARSGVSSAARPLVEAVRGCTDVPVAVGFGISGPEAVREVVSFADGAIVGSALINLLAESPAEERIERARAFTRRLAEGLSNASVA
jgi:tryptophan synthase alpha chain